MFLGVIAGRPQNISELVFFLAKTKNSMPLYVYWCMPPLRKNDSELYKPHPAALPIQSAIEPAKFSNILTCWLSRHDEWQNARVRYSNAISYQNKYEIDRLVGAANMFDILPPSAYQELNDLPCDIAQARDQARAIFKSLPCTPERDSILGALGRIGKASLKRKVRSRVKLISDIVVNRFPELELVTDQSIDCRNYYVHGSHSKLDYGVNFEQVHFFIDTLEFVFAASDLIESGWEINEWAENSSGSGHSFGEYRSTYLVRLSKLKSLLNGQ